MGVKRRSAGASGGNREVDALLAEFDPKIRSLALALRATIQQETPAATEQVYRGWRTVGYGHGTGMRSFFCAIAPHTSHVNLQLNYGTDLDDPDGLLEGTGKAARHVKIRKASDTRTAAIKDLIRQASDLAARA